MHGELNHAQQCVADLLLSYPRGFDPAHPVVYLKGLSGDWHHVSNTGESVSTGTVADTAEFDGLINTLDHEDALGGHSGIVFLVDEGSRSSEHIQILEEES